MSADVAVIVVSTNEASWLRACIPTVFAHAGGISLDLVVADNESTDGTRELILDELPPARVVTCANRGFSHANNRALETTDAPFVLFLNPDTEILDGTFSELVAYMGEHPRVGLVGVKQVTPDGSLFPTIRRFPSVSRWWGEALGSERLPIRLSALGERELDLEVYEHDVACDWTSGSFMFVRRETLDEVGPLDERFFIYCEEVDLCYRIRRAGWDIRHLPSMTILHHANKVGHSPRMSAQDAYARRQYMAKHFGPVRRTAGLGALAVRYGLRAVAPGRGATAARGRRGASRAALRTLVGIDPPPFGPGSA